MSRRAQVRISCGVIEQVKRGGASLPLVTFVREQSLIDYLKTLEGEGARPPVRCPRDVWMTFAPWMERETVEVFVVACLDAQHRLIAATEVSRGIVNSSLVHPREVFRAAIRCEAGSIVLIHNHPSGDPTPSADDRGITTQLVAAGRLLDIPVNDHLVLGLGRYVSFAEAGLL